MQVACRFRGTLVAGLVLTIISAAVAQYSGGRGTAEAPYQIATPADLIDLGNSPHDYDKQFVLTTDIDLDPNLPGGQVFAGALIGYPSAQTNLSGQGDYQSTPFMGVLDGNDHEIRNLVIEISWNSDPGSQGNYVGLIAQIGEESQVKRLGLQDVNIIGGSAGFVGALAGENRGAILACYSSGHVTGSGLVGGLVGGQYTGTIRSCHTAGSMEGSRVGGLVGLLWTGSVSSSYSTANVVKHPQLSDIIGVFDYAGGLVGRNWDATISSSWSSGDVTADVLAGGLAGINNSGTIHSCYSSGKVTGRTYAGGLVGTTGGPIVSCYATGNVSGRWGVGGLAGEAADGSIATSYSVGNVTGDYRIGGLVGGDGSTSAWLSYWDLQTSGLTESTAGEGKTTQEMRSPATFVGWGHDAQWTLAEGEDYPHLAWEGDPGLPITDPPRTYSGGTGAPNDPYIVRTTEDLVCLGESPADWSATFALADDIDLASIHPDELLRIGSRGLPFTGTLDGRNHTVRDLNVEASSRDGGSSLVGMFGRIGPSGIVRYLHLLDVTVSGGDFVGGLAGSNEGAILACSVSGLVTASGMAGGVAGENKGAITSSCATGTIDGGGRVGGLIGENGGMVSSCYAIATVSGYYVGGLVGENSGVLEECYSVGTVLLGRRRTGGLVGYNDPDSGTATACFWDTKTWLQTPDDVGEGKTTAEMQMISTFLDAGWDFTNEMTNGTEDIWWILEGKDYPRLWWELGEAVPRPGGTKDDQG